MDEEMRLQIVFGKWMLTERGLFRFRLHVAKKSPKTTWYDWDRIL